MKKISLDDLIGKIEPVVELEIQGVIYPVYPYGRMSEATTLRVIQTNANYEYTLDEVNREVAVIEGELRDVQARLDAAATGSEDTTDFSRKAALLAKRTAIQARLARPVREILEALAGMPADLLSAYPPGALAELFTEVSDAVFPRLEPKPVETPVILQETAAVVQPHVVQALTM